MIHIVLIEDNPGDVRLLQEMLRDANDSIDNVYDIQHFDQVGPAVSYLQTTPQADVVMSDISLPDSHGLETFQQLSPFTSDYPVVFMTGASEEGFAVEAIHRGAQDYLVKGLMTADSLAKTILFAIERHKSQREISRIQEEAVENRQRLKLLNQQKRQLLALNKTKDEFIALASHQLRTPATAVKQYIGMIVEGYVGDVDDKQLPLLQTAYASNERQLEIINELLKTAQLDSSRYQLNLARTNLDQLIGEVVTELQPILRLRSQVIDYVSEKPYAVRVDATEFKLVLINLLENASKYMAHDKTISVSVARAGHRIHISIQDQGVGISLEDQARIFDKFTRIDNEFSDTVTGSGLGLYWVRKIIRLHKGTIEVSSTLGQGSTFTIGLPA